ncbi:hypothetical protein HJFPF1_11951 [Paramyrothecium foliicola]|nr:hypothetical protein HJFPF1_11951 [Paramyrothecium foliicola]
MTGLCSVGKARQRQTHVRAFPRSTMRSGAATDAMEPSTASRLNVQKHQMSTKKEISQTRNYNDEWEASIKQHRKWKRLLVARNINFRTPQREFEAFCRSKLSKPDSVEFLWRPKLEPWAKHRGWAMLVFESRADRDVALADLGDGFVFKNKSVTIAVASQHAVSDYQDIQAHQFAANRTLQIRPLERQSDDAPSANAPTVTATAAPATSTAVMEPPSQPSTATTEWAACLRKMEK